jgi:hypothetical protein
LGRLCTQASRWCWCCTLLTLRCTGPGAAGSVWFQWQRHWRLLPASELSVGPSCNREEDTDSSASSDRGCRAGACALDPRRLRSSRWRRRPSEYAAVHYSSSCRVSLWRPPVSVADGNAGYGHKRNSPERSCIYCHLYQADTMARLIQRWPNKPPGANSRHAAPGKSERLGVAAVAQAGR